MVVGFEGAVRALVDGIAAELNWRDARVVHTGGASKYLERLAVSDGWLFDQRLVERGIARATVEELAVRSGSKER